jgi:diadenosine tetraphosphate (Ap4A) HIT family hydrolase
MRRRRSRRGYPCHVNEPTELTVEEASDYWKDVLTVAQALMDYYKPMKMNYETLGNSLPHLHTHLIPRFADNDPAPGRPFPLLPLDGSEPTVADDRLWSEARALRGLIAWSAT